MVHVSRRYLTAQACQFQTETTPCRFKRAHWQEILLPGALSGDLGLLAQTGWNQQQTQDLEEAIGDERH
jgi:hypothetical protein